MFAHYLGTPRKVVVKCTATSIFSLPAVRRIWPHVPFVLLIRDPVEVFMSNYQRTPRWILDWPENPRLIGMGRPPREVTNAGFTELCAWTIGQCYSAATTVLDDKCIVVDYQELSSDISVSIARYFGLDFSSEGLAQLPAVFRANAKRPNLAFEPDEEAKRGAATERIRETVERWAGPAYRLLLERARPDLRKKEAGWSN